MSIFPLPERRIFPHFNIDSSFSFSFSFHLCFCFQIIISSVKIDVYLDLWWLWFLLVPFVLLVWLSSISVLFMIQICRVCNNCGSAFAKILQMSQSGVPIGIVKNQNDPLKSSNTSFVKFHHWLCSEIFEGFFFFKFMNSFSNSHYKRFYITLFVIVTFIWVKWNCFIPEKGKKKKLNNVSCWILIIFKIFKIYSTFPTRFFFSRFW